VKKRMVIAVVLMVVVPLAALAWLGAWVARRMTERVVRRFDELLASRLADVDADIGQFIERRERQLLELTQLPSTDPDFIRARLRVKPYVRQIFCLDARGELIHPAPGSPLTQGERDFLQRTRDIWLDKELLYAQGRSDSSEGPERWGGSDGSRASSPTPPTVALFYSLSLRDLKILQLFHANRGRVLDRYALFSHVWGLDHVPNSRTLDQHISQLRKRIERDPKPPALIHTVHGVGYRYDGP